MPTQIGRFELLSEIAKSDRGCIYKANDSTNGQTVALKTLRLEMPEEQAKALLQRVEAEADTISALNSPNIAQLFGVGEFENILCAAMEYVQGNSIATMLARKEGFSIWDLLDISRQVCLGLDHAHSRGVVHYSFEPAKVMVQWDGTVKILSFGISTMGMLPRELSGKAPILLHYASPEQLRGEPIDPRSNFFSWAAILYEMVTDQKAFDGESAEEIQHRIVEESPVPPAEINRKIHPAVNDLLMKALSKLPDHRFQNGQQLIAELEQCKQASVQGAKKSNTPAQGLIAPTKVNPSAATKPAGQAQPAPAPAQPATAAKPKTAAATPEETKPTPPETQAEPDILVLEDTNISVAPQAKPASTSAPNNKAAAAAAAAGGSHATSKSPQATPPESSAQQKRPTGEAVGQAPASKQPRMSAAAAKQAEPAARKFAVDPMMSGNAAAGRTSFSELEEMPPLKEVHVAPEAPKMEALPEPAPVLSRRGQTQKPKVQPAVVAKQAIKEIRSVPPRLMMYAIAAAVALVLLLAIALAFHIRSQNAEDEGTPATTTSQQQSAAPAPAPVAESAAPEPPAANQAETATPVEVAPVLKPRHKHKSAPPARAAALPGQVAVDSNPQGAQVQVDGRTDSSWVTPLTVTQLTPGHHTISLSKSGYVSEARALDVASGSKSSLVLHLAVAGGTISVRSDPEGAMVYVDSHDTGRVTPVQISVEKGSHTLLVKKQGYLDETTSANVQAGQNFHFAPTLRALGNADDIKTVGKFKKIFGGSETAGMGTVSIKTQPKGAQIAVNRRMLDKASPVQFMLDPGNYIIDISASGYKSIHRVVTVEKGGKVVLDEAMQPQ
jgi:eukaryotic-like serine/threonine-protein kinase